MRYLLIYNPTSRSGRSRKDLNEIEKEFRERSMEYELIETEYKDHAIKISMDTSFSNGYDVIVAVGGDGTICEVITGMMTVKELGNDTPVFGAIHVGTSPDFNRFHSIPKKIPEAVELLKKAKPSLIDIGKATYMGLDDREHIGYFGSSVNLGLGSSIASGSNNRYRKYLGDLPGTFLSTLVSLAGYKSSDFDILLDGEPVKVKNLVNLTVGKDPHIASGMRVPIDMSPDNGVMYCLTISAKSKLSLLKNVWRMYKGDIRRYKGAKFRFCEELEVKDNRNKMVEFDGDHRGFLPVKVEVLEKALEVICDGQGN